MAVQTIYFLGTVGVTPNFWGNTQLNGTAPTAANSAFGWKPAKTAVTTPYYRGRLGATAVGSDAAIAASYNAARASPQPGTGTGAATAGDSFIAGPFTGTFANTAWVFTGQSRCTTAGATGRHRVRLWRGANANGSGAVQVAANFGLGIFSPNTTTDSQGTGTIPAPGAVTFNNEYLFIQVEWEETTAGTSNNNDIVFRIGTALLTTPDFVPIIDGDLALNQAAQTISAAGNVPLPPRTGTLSATQAAQTVAAQGRIVVGGTLARTEADDTIVARGYSNLTADTTLYTADETKVTADHFNTGPSGTLALTEISDTLAAAGTVASGGMRLWVPTDLGTDLIGWFDAHDAATITITGSGVSAWGNKGVGAFSLTQVSTLDVNRPIYASNAVTFNTPQVLATTNPLAIITYDFLVVGKPNDLSDWRTLIHNSDGHNLILIHTGAYDLGAYNEIPPYFRQAGTLTWPVVDGLAYGQIGSGAVSQTISRDGGSLTSTGSLQPVDKTPVNFVGGYYSVANNGNQGFGSIYELIFVPYTSSDDTRQKLEGYAAWKWGLQGLLPSDHPYKSAAPTVGTAPTGVTGTLAVTESNDTLVAAGGPRVGGVLTANQAAQTVAATGGPRVGGTLTATEALDTIVAAGGPRVGGVLTANQATQTIVAAGGPRVGGTLTANQAVQTIAATGTVLSGASGTLTANQAAQIITATGNVPVVGTLVIPQAAQTLVAAGGPRVGGTLTVNQATQTLIAAGDLRVGGTLTSNQAAQTLVAAGGPRVGGTLTATEALDTISAFAFLPATGTLAITEPADTIAATGAVGVVTDVVLLCHFDNAPFVDVSTYHHTLTPTNVTVSTPNPKFGAGCGYWTFGNLNGNIDTGSASDFWFDAAPFTIEAWIFANSNPSGDGYNPILAEWDAVLGNVGFFFNVFPHMMFFCSPDGTTYDYVDSTTTPSQNAWHHVAVDRDASNIVRLYLDGAVVGSKTLSFSIFHSTYHALIGNDASLGRAFPGALDEVRVVRGTAMYGGAFTPPTVPYLPAEPAPSIIGTLTANQAAQTLAAQGRVTIGGALSVIETADTITATGTVAVRGTLNVTELSDVVTATGTVAVRGTLTANQAANTVSATGGQIVSGTLTANQAANTLAAVIRATVGGTLTANQAAQTVAATGTAPVVGILIAPQAAQTIAATAGPVVRGTLTANQAAQTIAATGSVVTGTSAALTALQAAQTLSAVGRVPYVGTLTATEALDTIAATGTVAVRGTLTATEALDTIVATAGPVVRGTLTANQVAQTISATGGPVVLGTLTATEALDTISATAGVTVRGTLSVNETADTIAATGTVLAGASATLNVTEALDTIAAAAGVAVRGTLTANQAANTIAAIGKVVVGGTLGVTEVLDTVAAVARVSVGAILNVAENLDSIAATGTVAIRGTLGVVEAADTINATALLPATGALHVTQVNQILVAAGTIRDRVTPSFPVYGGVTGGRYVVTGPEDRLVASGAMVRSVQGSNGMYRSVGSKVQRRTVVTK